MINDKEKPIKQKVNKISPKQLELFPNYLPKLVVKKPKIK